MQDCFERQDIGGLQKVAVSMDPEEFKKHLKRCVDSGLWLPDARKGDSDGNVEDSNKDEAVPDNVETEIRQRKNVSEK